MTMCEPYMKPTKISGLSLNAGFPASRFRVEHEFGGTSAATSDADGAMEGIPETILGSATLSPSSLEASCPSTASSSQAREVATTNTHPSSGNAFCLQGLEGRRCAYFLPSDEYLVTDSFLNSSQKSFGHRRWEMG